MKKFAILAIILVALSFSSASAGEGFKGFIEAVIGTSGHIEKIESKNFQWQVSSGTRYVDGYEYYTVVAETESGLKWVKIPLPLEKTISINGKEYFLLGKDVGSSHTLFRVLEIGDDHKVTELTKKGVMTSCYLELKVVNGTGYVVATHMGPGHLVDYFNFKGEKIGFGSGSPKYQDKNPVVTFSDGSFQSILNLETGKKSGLKRI